MSSRSTRCFFSRTDARGVIQFGNDVFIAISGYKREELLGAPHNIIRHPDMPKTVFKLFWDTLQAGKPIVAYVKNMATSGDHYWVLAAAYPVSNGYLSIRIKPTSPIFSQVQEIYTRVLSEEKERGVEAAGKLLEQLLSDAGFANYDAFSTAAVFAELKSRDSFLKQLLDEGGAVSTSVTLKKGNRAAMEVISQIDDVATDMEDKFRRLFGVLEGFEKTSAFFQKRVTEVLVEFEELGRISLNLRILAANFGEKGLPLGTIAAQFQSLAVEIESHLKNFSKTISTTGESMQGCTFNVASVKLQTDMVSFFVRESIDQVMKGSASFEQAFAALDQNTEIFSQLCRDSGKEALERLARLSDDIHLLERSAREVKKFVNGLDVIEKMGAVEAGRFSSIQQVVHGHMHHLSSFKEVLRTAVADLLPTIRTLVANISLLDSSVRAVSGGLDQTFLLATVLRGLESKSEGAQSRDSSFIDNSESKPDFPLTPHS